MQVNTGDIVMWETQHNIADLDYFKTLILQETSKTHNQHHEEFCAYSGVTRCANKLDLQETDFRFLCSTEAEIISLDAGLRMDGVPALTLWIW